MPQVTNNASAHTGGKAARAHDRLTPHRDHDGREGRDHEHGRADLVVDTKGPRGTIVPGRKYKWPFEVTNRGTVPAKDVALTAMPDKSLKVLSAPPKCRWRQSGPLVCQIGFLPQGKTRRGTITATVVPRAHNGKALNNPVQVSWRNAPTGEKRLAAFPPVEISPGGSAAGPGTGTDTGTDTDTDGRVPYPLMVTEHGPVTAESVVVRSPIGAPAPEGPCANGVPSGKIAGKSTPIKPALGPCGAKQDDPAACGCGAAAHERPAADLPPTENAVIPDRPAKADRPVAANPDVPVTAPCGAVVDRPVVVPDRPVVPPCAQGRPEAEQGRPAAAPSSATTADKPAADRPATDQPAGSVPDNPATDKPVTDKPVTDKPVVDRPAATPCGAAADRPVILPGRPVIMPDHPAVPSCAGAPGKPDAAPSSAADKPAPDKAAVDRPATAPCGATAARPVAVPERPVVVPDMPAIPPCAQGSPGACGCLNSQGVPAAPAADSAVPQRPAVPGPPEAAPCAAADKPMGGKDVSERPVGPSCGAGQEAPAAVHQEPGTTPEAPAAVHEEPATVPGTTVPGTTVPGTTVPGTTVPGTATPMTPLAGPGKAAHHPLGRPHHHVPLRPGRPHRDCVRQGTGFVCPLGSASHHRPHVLNLRSPGSPHALHCVGAAGAACHTREARPVAMRPQPVGGRLPVTGGSSALLALSGVGLAGAGMVLYRLSRTRREETE
jgi:hypothetical protein